MKFLFLIYHDEKTLDALPEPEMQALVDGALDYSEEIRRSGHYIVSNALQRTRTARTIRVRGGQGGRHRRPLRRDEGAARRLLPRRGQGHRRGLRGRRAIPARAAGDHRGPAGPGARAFLAGPSDHERGVDRRRARAGGHGLPGGLAPRPRHPDPPPRRLRHRRGGDARGLRRRGGAVAAGRHAGQSARLARVHRPLQGHRRHPPARPLRRLADRAGRPARRGSGRRRTARARRDRGRPPPPDLHLLPPRPAARTLRWR